MAVRDLLISLSLFHFGFSAIVDFTKEFDIKSLYRNARDRNSYIKARNDILLEEQNMRIGHDVVLNANEQKVNAILMKYKQLEVNRSRVHNGEPFPPSVNFLVGKPLVEKSKVFQIIKSMPKGTCMLITSENYKSIIVILICISMCFCNVPKNVTFQIRGQIIRYLYVIVPYIVQ